MNVLLFYSTTERCFLVLGVICATILGCCVPAAVYSVGEVVNLFITNRRSRLAALIDHERQLGHPELANDITDYDGDTEALMDELSRDLDETVATVDSINSSSQIGLLDRLHGNITTADELLLNQELNVDFLDRLYFLIGCLVVISCTQFVTASTMTMVFNICTQRMASRWRKVIQSEEFINLENKEFSTISLLKDIEQIERGLGVRFPHLIFGFVTLIGCLILAFFKRWELAMILLPILFVGLFGKPLVTKLQKKSNQRVSKARNEAKNSLEKSLENLSTVVAFQGKTTEILKYEQSLYHVKTAVDHKMVIIGIGNGMLTMIPHLLNAIMLWIGVRLIISDLNRSIDKFLPGTPVMVFFCYLRGLLTFNKGWIFYDDIKKAFKSVEKLVKVMKVLRIGKKGFFEINLQIADEKLKNVQSRDKKNFFSFGDRRLRTPSAVHRLAFPMNSSRLRFSSLDERKSLELGNCKETLVLLIRFVTPDAIYLVVGCFASILLGIIFPMLFYMFCEIIGAMANLDDDTVYRRTTSCVIIYACLGAATLLEPDERKSCCKIM